MCIDLSHVSNMTKHMTALVESIKSLKGTPKAAPCIEEQLYELYYCNKALQAHFTGVECLKEIDHDALIHSQF